jgi:hypothetical protein
VEYGYWRINKIYLIRRNEICKISQKGFKIIKYKNKYIQQQIKWRNIEPVVIMCAKNDDTRMPKKAFHYTLGEIRHTGCQREGCEVLNENGKVLCSTLKSTWRYERERKLNVPLFALICCTVLTFALQQYTVTSK